MKNYGRFLLVLNLILLFLIAVGCGPTQLRSLPEDFDPTCIQGKVWYRTSTDSTLVPYPHARITAWRHGTDQPLAETKADDAGNYCIQVPLGDSRVDLRVWGMKRSQGVTYTCKGSETNIDPGASLKRCGEDCVRLDIVTDCQDLWLPYHRQVRTNPTRLGSL